MDQHDSSRHNVTLGIDAYSLRSQGWTPFQILDYSRSLGGQVVHFSEIRFLGSLETEHLLRVRTYAAELGIRLEVGMRSICCSSQLFDPSQGTPEEQLRKMIAAACTIGSPIVRVVMGNMADRTGPVPLETHIANTVKTLRAIRSQALDIGIKVAVENHSGDMRADELRTLIEEVGTDFVGACLDSGNPLITLEDPHLSLQVLANYVLTSHVRDTAIWLSETGINVAWVRMGEGNVGIDDYVQRFAELCPNRSLCLEIIESREPRIFPYRDESFWAPYHSVPAWQFARYLNLAETGKPLQIDLPCSEEQVLATEREALEASVRYTRKLLGSEKA